MADAIEPVDEAEEVEVVDIYEEVEMGNYENVQYYGYLLFGGQEEEHTFIFDTGSAQLWVPSTDCRTCHTTNLYNKEDSPYYERVSNERKVLNYEVGSAEGYYS